MKKYLFLRLFLKKKKRKKTILPRKFITHFIFLYLSLTYHMEYKINLSTCINLFNSHTRYTICLYFINKYLIKTLFPHVKHLSIDILKRTNIAFKSISRFKLNLVAKHLEYWMKIRLISNYFSEPILYKTIFTIPRISQYILKYILYIFHHHLTYSQTIFFSYIHLKKFVQQPLSKYLVWWKFEAKQFTHLFDYFPPPWCLPLIPVIFCSDETAYTPGNTYASNDPLYTHIHTYTYISSAFLGRGRDTRPRKRYTHRRLIFAHGAKPDWYSSHSRHTYSHPRHQG